MSGAGRGRCGPTGSSISYDAAMSGRSLKELEKVLGHEFRDKELLERALTHASATNTPGPDFQSYQRLEFLGDRVLGLVVADMLTDHFPDATEGDLSRRLARLVSGVTCAEVGEEMGLLPYVRIATSVPKSGSRARAGVLGDVCESVIGALYRDGGLGAARPVIERYWKPLMAGMDGPLRDAKTELQEWAHRQGLVTPLYAETARSGPDHAPDFEVEVRIGALEPGRGSGRSKREAEHDAAARVLRREGVWVGP